MHEVALLLVADPCLHRPGGPGGDGGVGDVVELGAVDVGPGGAHLIIIINYYYYYYYYVSLTAPSSPSVSSCRWAGVSGL